MVSPQQYSHGPAHADEPGFLETLIQAVAHDANNLLTAALGNLQLLDGHPDVDEGLEPMVADARLACDRMQSLVRTLQTVGGVRRVQLESVDLFDVVDRVRRRLGDKAPSMRVDSEDLTVRGDVRMLEELVTQVCERSTARGRRQGELRIEHEGDRVILRAIDAMAPENAPTDLSRWFLLDQDAARRGSAGLTLPAIGAAVDELGGEASATRVVEGGIQLTVALPAVTVVRAHSDTKPGRTLRVLLMDDDPAVRETTERMLTGAGHECISVGDGEAALAAWSAAARLGVQFDVLLSDIVVPDGMGGPETVARLRGTWGDIPAVAMSGHHAHPAVRTPEAYGFAAALTKPFDLQSLEQRLQDAVRIHHRAERSMLG